MNQGLELLVVGMTVVFAFLGLLVVIMYGSAAVFQRLAPYFPDEPASGAAAVDDAARIAAVIAAVAAHRQQQ